MIKIGELERGYNFKNNLNINCALFFKYCESLTYSELIGSTNYKTSV